MIGPEQTYMVISLAFAVFAAIAAVGAAITLSISFERLRNGFAKVREMVDVLNRQTGFFSTAIHNMEQRVDALDVRQDALEAQTAESNARTDSMLRYAENMVVQAKHEMKQEIAEHHGESAQNSLEQPQELHVDMPKAPVRSGMDALLADNNDQNNGGKEDSAASIYFDAGSDHIRFV
ncbi:MAG: hypothetical protein VX803_11100 [Pseudomonadota bacterium]|jgi:hypothetical protein|nr:hypothetical protein [Pseudomonadota bacterium]MEC9236781.1 hypothetical protein [Pseudomonadota bacterium]